MSHKLKDKKFSCTKCGVPYEAHPPDDKHIIASMVKEEAKKDYIMVKNICKNCGNTDTIYWIHQTLDPAFHV